MSPLTLSGSPTLHSATSTAISGAPHLTDRLHNVGLEPDHNGLDIQRTQNEREPLLRHEHSEESSDAIDWSSRPRWRSPSPVWVLALVGLAAISTSAAIAPRLEVYTKTMCQVHGHGDARDTESCMSDPSVQASVAQLLTVISSTTGLISALTTGWWAALSDRYGRVRILSLNVAGVIISDIGFLIVAHSWSRIPGGYWMYAVAPLIEGFFGSMSLASALAQAYISDCTPPGSRSRIFSMLLGLLFGGMGLGPVLSGFFIRATHNLFLVFYATASFDVLLAMVVWFVMPESLSAARMEESRRHHTEQTEERPAEKGLVHAVNDRLRRMFSFLEPLLVLLPKKSEIAENNISRRDWSLTILAGAYASATLVSGSLNQQFQYATYTFRWTAENLSYFLGVIFVARAMYLTLILPAILRYLSASPAPSQSSTEDLVDGQLAQDKAPFVDLLLSRVAMMVDVVSYLFLPLASTGVLFTALSVCAAIGTTFAPTTQSLALEIYARQGGTDTGKVLGAFSVLSAISSHIVGPAVFGLAYMKTVATFPGAIFYICCACLMTTLSLLLFVRLPKPLVQ